MPVNLFLGLLEDLSPAIAGSVELKTLCHYLAGHIDGEKGQQHLRYNVNGILLDSCAFSKLKNEISLKCVKMKLKGERYRFYMGQFPDVNGLKKDLIIRQGKVGIWRDSKIGKDAETNEFYYMK